MKHKNKFIFLASLLLFISSCTSTKSIKDYNYISANTLYNDSLNFKTEFLGDIAFKPLKKQKVKRKIKNISQLRYEDFLLYGKTFIEPFYEVLFFYDTKEQNIKNQNYTTLLDHYTSSGRVLCKKTAEGKTAYLLLLGQKENQKNMEKDAINMIRNFTPEFIVREKLNYWTIFSDYQNESNVLFLKNKIEKAPVATSRQNEWDKFQILSTLLSRVSNSNTYSKLIDEYERPKKAQYKAKIDSMLQSKSGQIYNKLQFQEKIKTIASVHPIIMLNERHWFPHHRILAAQMLETLKDEGFKYLAVEAVFEDSTFNSLGFPLGSTGYYTKEPYFGLFLRKAHQLGYKVIGYDDYKSGNREQGQAENIFKILEKDPEARIFVYAGEDHIYERNSKVKRMAEYFKELSEIDPVTIDQVQLSADNYEEILLFKKEIFSEIVKVNTSVDYFLLNNIRKGLGTFFCSDHLKSISFPLSKTKIKEAFVSVYLFDEYKSYKDTAVPIYNTILPANSKFLELELPVGKFFIRIMDENNQKILAQELTVE